MGAPSQPGVNVGKIDVDAGLECARGFNTSELHMMLVATGSSGGLAVKTKRPS
jgi:hypothetical protein